MTSKSKNDIFYLILLVLTLITLLVGVTFTYYSLLAKEKDDSTYIKTGTLAINYIDGGSISPTGLLPTTEPSIDTTNSIYKKKFSVRSSGTLDQNLDIYIEVKENTFTTGSLKYALYNSANQKLSSGSLPNNGSILLSSGIYLKNNATEDFTVLIWLEENNQNQDNEKGKSFVGGFNIIANQLKY